jgi:DNA polymerase elongation subunit (family B)
MPFEPFMLLTDEDELRGWKGECRVECLAGRARFRRLVFFADLASVASAHAHLKKRSGGLAGPEAPYVWFDDPVHQYLLISGMTHFHGLGFGDLRRMQIDLETYCGSDFEFPNARRESDRITAIAMSDTTGWERIISGRELGEAEMLEAMAAEIQCRDPDVLEGHNFFRFDLTYLLLRAQRYGVDLDLGRDGSAVKGHPARLQLGARRLNFVNHGIFGRHVIDTWFLAQLYGLRTRELDRYGLKDVARRFGVAPAGRTYIPGDRASWYFDHEPDTLFRYALDDVRETRAVSNLLSPLYFAEAQILPFSYQNVAVASEVSKIDALMLRAYLAERRSIPDAGKEEIEVRDSCEVRVRGRAENVLRCGVVSLHASSLLALGQYPESDVLGVLPRLVQRLSRLRTRADSIHPGETRSAGAEVGAACETILGGLLSYLTCAEARFRDPNVGARIAREAQGILAKLGQRVERWGGRVIEVAAASLSFALPSVLARAETRSQLIRELAALLPGGVDLRTKGPYPAVFTYDAKNRALLDQDGHMTVIGAALRPPGMERFQRNCLEEMVRLLLEAREREIPALYEQYRAALQTHQVEISLLAKTETLQESLEEYQIRVKGARRRPRGIYEIALRSGRAYLEGDKLSYYVTGEGANVKVGEHCKHVSEWARSGPDENVEYYKARLREVYELLRPFVVEES